MRSRMYHQAAAPTRDTPTRRRMRLVTSPVPVGGRSWGRSAPPAPAPGGPWGGPGSPRAWCRSGRAWMPPVGCLGPGGSRRGPPLGHVAGVGLHARREAAAGAVAGAGPVARGLALASNVQPPRTAAGVPRHGAQAALDHAAPYAAGDPLTDRVAQARLPHGAGGTDGQGGLLAAPVLRSHGVPLLLGHAVVLGGEDREEHVRGVALTRGLVLPRFDGRNDAHGVNLTSLTAVERVRC